VIKLFFLAIWYRAILAILFRFDAQPLPHGICQYVECTIFTTSVGSLGTGTIILVFSALYLFERKMLLSTFILFAISLLLISLERSNGILHRREIWTLILFAQFLYYLLRKFELSWILTKGDNYVMPVQFSKIMIAFAYVTSAITKLQDAGMGFILDAPNISLQILKNNGFYYANTGNYEYIETGKYMAGWILSDEYFTMSLLAVALIMELLAFIGAYDKRMSFLYGVLLVIMHLFILCMIDVFLVSFFSALLIFYINLPYFLYLPIKRAINTVYQVR